MMLSTSCPMPGKRPRRFFFYVFFQVVWIASQTEYGLAQQNETNEVETDMPSGAMLPSAVPSNELSGNLTTTIPPMSQSPSELPTMSNHPTTSNFPTAFPTMTAIPTISVMPTTSDAPTVTSRPTMIPTSSSEPTMLPSDLPSHMPSYRPSMEPTETPPPSLTPTISPKPTVSNMPTISLYPSVSSAPSIRPTTSPSDWPTDAPTISSKPSDLPSASPSTEPSMSSKPSDIPSLSLLPSVSLVPSTSPSAAPTGKPSPSPSMTPSTASPTNTGMPSDSPSSQPTSFPSDFPSSEPTPTWMEITASRIVMVLEGFKELDAQSQKQWEKVTSAYMMSVYETLRRDFPDVFPIEVTNVITRFESQVSPSVASRRRFLQQTSDIFEIQYNQTITYGLRWSDEDFDKRNLFEIPFEFDWKGYMTILLDEFDIDGIIKLERPLSITLTLEPERENRDRLRTYQAALIAVIPVVIGLAIVAYAFYRTYKLDERRRLAQMEREDQIEFSTGEAIDWTPSYTIPSQDIPTGADETGIGTARTVSTLASQNTFINAGNNNPPIQEVSHDLTARLSRERHARHSSNSLTRQSMTEITVDASEGFHEEHEGVTGPNLPTPELETFNLREAPLSPVHIPDEEAENDISEDEPEVELLPSSPSAQDILGLEDRGQQPSLEGFQMQIQDLE